MSQFGQMQLYKEDESRITLAAVAFFCGDGVGDGAMDKCTRSTQKVNQAPKKKKQSEGTKNTNISNGKNNFNDI